MIQGWLVGDKELVARLQAMPGKLRAGLGKAMLALAVELQGKVMREKLSGQVLHVKTGTLRRSITQKVEITDTTVSGIVGTTVSGIAGTNVAYAARHEYGFSGTESVKEHLRTITKAFGKEIKAGAKTFTVRAHIRNVNYPAHSFLRSALAEMEPEIKTAMTSAVVDAIKG